MKPPPPQTTIFPDAILSIRAGNVPSLHYGRNYFRRPSICPAARTTKSGLLMRYRRPQSRRLLKEPEKAIPNQDASSIVALGFAHAVHIRDRHISAFPISHRFEEKFPLGES